MDRPSLNMTWVGEKSVISSCRKETKSERRDDSRPS
jgi:hypothetical protein